jgi:hypothetical protein
MTTKQIKYVMYLLNQHGLTEQREEIAWEVSGGRTSKLSELSYQETNALIKRLNGGSPRDKMIGKILSMAHEMGWEVEGGKVDMDRINAWCEKYSPMHKTLDNHGDNELPALVTAFEKVHLSFLKGL